MVFLMALLMPTAEGAPVSLVNRKLQLILYIVRSYTAKPLEPGPKPFCQCVGLFEKCDYFLMHKTNHVHCSFLKRYCCTKDALEQMLHKRVNGRWYIPPKAMAFKPHKDYIHLPQIKTQAAKTARSKCGCSLPFWTCHVAISKPWKILHKSFQCSLSRIFCCEESFLKDVVVPTVKLHTALTKAKG